MSATLMKKTTAVAALCLLAYRLFQKRSGEMVDEL